MPDVHAHLTAAALLLAAATQSVPAYASTDGQRPSTFVTNFGDPHQSAETPPRPSRLDDHIDYSLDPRAEKFLVRVPGDYAPDAEYGLVVYMHPGNDLDAPPVGWAAVLDRRRFIFVAPLRAGNGEAPSRRMGLAVLAAEEMTTHYRIAPARIIAAGWSGGARIASELGFYQADLFRGTVQSCGSDFFRPVPHIDGSGNDGVGGHSYGLVDATSAEIAMAAHVRFTLITGSGDWRHGDMLDIYNGGFARTTLQAKLIDVPGMEHANANADTFDAALGFIEAPSRPEP